MMSKFFKITISISWLIALSVASTAVEIIFQNYPKGYLVNFSLLIVLIFCSASYFFIKSVIRKKSNTTHFLWILCVACIARSIIFWIDNHKVFSGDDMAYRRLAMGVLRGEGLHWYDTHFEIDWRALFPPAYPLLLAATGWFGGLSPKSIWMTNLVLDLASIFALRRIGRKLDMPQGGLIAAWLFAFWPSIVWQVSLAQKESLILLEVLLLVELLCAIWKDGNRSWARACGYGILSGALALTQPGLAPFPALMMMMLLGRQSLAEIFIFGLRSLPFLLMVMTPWWVRNALIFGTFIPLTTTMGYGLWIANHWGATGGWVLPPPELRRGDELQAATALRQEAVRWIILNPGQCLKYALAKIHYSLAFEQNFPLSGKLPHGLDAAKDVSNLAAQFLHSLLLTSMLATPRARAMRAYLPLSLLLAAGWAQILLSGGLFEFVARHRYFLTPFFFLMLGLVLTPLPRLHPSEMQRPPIG